MKYVGTSDGHVIRVDGDLPATVVAVAHRHLRGYVSVEVSACALAALLERHHDELEALTKREVTFDSDGNARWVEDVAF